MSFCKLLSSSRSGGRCSSSGSSIGSSLSGISRSSRSSSGGISSGGGGRSSSAISGGGGSRSSSTVSGGGGSRSSGFRGWSGCGCGCGCFYGSWSGCRRSFLLTASGQSGSSNQRSDDEGLVHYRFPSWTVKNGFATTSSQARLRYALAKRRKFFCVCLLHHNPRLYWHSVNSG